MRILITGAAGFIGSHVCDRLLGEGASVIGLDSFDDFYDPSVKERNLDGARSHARFSLVRGDIRDQEVLASLPDGIDAVIHLAARAGVRPSIENPPLYSDVNVMGTTRLLEWMKDRSVSNLVFASSSSVYGNNRKVPFSEDDRVDHPISPYAATKKAGELLCHTASHLNGLSVACLRFFTVYGPRQRPDLAIHKFVRLLRRDEPIPVFGDGSTARDYTYVDDTVSGIVKSLGWIMARDGGCDVFNLGNHEAVTLAELIRAIGEEMGLEPRTDRLPMQPGDVNFTYADIAKAREAFGYMPATSLPVGLRRFLEWIDADSGASEPTA